MDPHTNTAKEKKTTKTKSFRANARILHRFNSTGNNFLDKLEKYAKDRSAENLSYVGRSAYRVLRVKHVLHHHKLWNVSSGIPIGSMLQTPQNSIFSSTNDPSERHSDWFPEKMLEIMGRTKVWCDIMSLTIPDGIFLDKLIEGLSTIVENAKNAEKPVVIRILVGNIIGAPARCTYLVKKLTKNLSEDANIHRWVGAWRKGVSWNHAKLIAVDGRYLLQGGHNLWDAHYLKNNPVHDLSMEMEGRITHDGHLFANSQWRYIRRKQLTRCGYVIDRFIPDAVLVPWKSRVTVTEYPVNKASEFPPIYNADLVPKYEKPSGSVPTLSLGRYGRLTFGRPSDDAFIAMFGSAKTIIRLSIQDLGPVCVPKTQIALPGCTWPKPYLNALAEAIWDRDVKVEIVVSNPGSVPGGLNPLEANYGNGWSCVDCAAEIIKRIQKEFKNNVDDVALRTKVENNLRICYIRHAGKNVYDDGKSIGNHSKFLCIDNIASYTGSQNLYVCDLAEWGVLIDDKSETEKILEDYWNPLWEASFIETDCDVQKVMDSLQINRDGEPVNKFLPGGKKKLDDAAKMASVRRVLV